MLLDILKERFEARFLISMSLHATYYGYRSVHLGPHVVTGNTDVEEWFESSKVHTKGNRNWETFESLVTFPLYGQRGVLGCAQQA